MFRSVAAATLAVSVAGLPAALGQTVSKDPANAPAGSYDLDPSHSQVLFSISHIGLTQYYGRFDRVSGSLDFDSKEPANSKVNVSIDTTSLDTPSGGVNDELKSEVFATRAFPAATFRSTSLTRTGPDGGKLTGDLTIKNVTKPVILDVTFEGGEEDPLNGSYALGFRATGAIKRTDFGLTGMEWEPLVGDDVSLTIEAMFEKRKS